MKQSLTALAVIALLAASPAAAQNLIIRGGTIHTGVANAPRPEVVIVRGGIIDYVGEDPGATRDALQEIDLKGATLFPGFTDGHAHLDGIGWRELTLNLEGSASLAEAMAKLTAWAEAHPTGPIMGRGWIETRWPESANGPRFLTAADLDAAAPGRVVLLGRTDGHAVTASTAALAAAGIDATTQAPSGGEIARGPDGEPTGFLLDAAMDLVETLRPQADPQALRDAYRAGFRVEAAYGWTGVHFMSAPWKDIPLLEQMAEAGEAPIRVYNSVTPDGAEALIASGPRSVSDGRVVTRAIKFYVDGALGSRGAALFEPYSDDPHTTGLLQTSAAQISPLYEQAFRSGIQVATHAIGDRANYLVLDWYLDAMMEVNGQSPAARDHRWRIEHAQIMRPADERRFAALNIIPRCSPATPSATSTSPPPGSATRDWTGPMPGRACWTGTWSWSAVPTPLSNAVIPSSSSTPPSPAATSTASRAPTGARQRPCRASRPSPCSPPPPPMPASAKRNWAPSRSASGPTSPPSTST